MRSWQSLADGARDAAADVPAAITLAAEVGAALPHPGAGDTAHLWSALATLGAADLTVARVVEPHLDALAILDQAGREPAPGVWGVYAAEGPGTPLQGRAEGSAWTLSGRKHWCSLAGRLDRALVSAWVGEERRLFEVDLHHDGVVPVAGTGWPAGCRTSTPGRSTSTPCRRGPSGRPAGTSSAPASRGAGSAWPPSGTAARSASPAACGPPRPAAGRPTRSR